MPKLKQKNIKLKPARKKKAAKIIKKDSYDELLLKKKKFAKKVKQGKKFKDTDGDGLSDYEEKYIYHTDSNNPDTDGDGMSDGEEVKRGRNPLGPGTLKDLFIPHAGNNFHPHSLKPKRLLFHALSVVAIKAVVVIFVLAYPMSAWLSPDMALAEAKKIIALTNNFRQSLSLGPLSESQVLNQAAYQKVEDMAVNQYFAHISPAGLNLKYWLKIIGYNYSIAGENLAVGFSKAEEVVEAWKNSPTHYDNIIENNFKEIGVAMADGKLNQVDTAFIAQYFGSPAAAVITPVQTPTIEPKNEVKIEETTAPTVNETAKPAPVTNKKPETIIERKKLDIKTTAPELSEYSTVATSTAEFLNTPSPSEPAMTVQKDNEIFIDQETAILSIKSDPLNNDKAIQIETVLPVDTVFAKVIINGKIIILNKTPDEINLWSGVALIRQDEEKNILNPLIPASIDIADSAGEIKKGKIDWDEIKILKTTPLEQYEMYKSNPSKAMATIMNLSGIYFKIILGLALIALLLNIFIEIRRQHHHIIIYSFAFISLLVAMIIF